VFTFGRLVGIFPLQGNPTDEAIGTALVLVFYGVVVATIVAFCVWLHRVVGNMASLGVAGSQWTAGSAVAWCFVPFAFFIQPMWSVFDAWRGSDASARRIDLKLGAANKAPAVLLAWWLLWLVAALAALLGAKASGMVESVMSVVAIASFTGAALFCILVIRDVTGRQERKHDLITSGQLA